MNIHLLSGFLGSGKTTAIQSACLILSDKGIRTGVITNDQGVRLVDADFFRRLGIPGRQVMNGCFCCNYQDLDNQIQSLTASVAPELIFAESVGSCTDIIATVLKPLHLYLPDAWITLSVFADALLLHMLLVDRNALFDEAVNYIYFKQLEESTVLIINKIDLLNPDQLRDLKDLLNEQFPDKVLHYQQSQNKDQVGQWLKLLDQAPSALIPRSLEMDYQIYGEGEAKLAWLDQEIEIKSTDETANQGAIRLMRDIFQRIVLNHYPIGHLKFLLNGREKISFTSTSSPDIVLETTAASTATLLLNGRVQTDPETLSRLVSDSIGELEEQTSLRIRTQSISAFRPGFPRPTHRLV